MPTASIRHRAYLRAYEIWFSSLPPGEQRRLTALGLDKAEADAGRAGSGVGVHEDAADRPEASETWDPAEIESSPGWEQELTTGLTKALAWTAEGKTLVEMGQRLTIVMHLWKPALLAGLALEIERELAEEFQEECDEKPDPGIGAVLEWISRGTSLSQWGQRFLAVVYVISPGIIHAPTLARIGSFNTKTRQAIDKLVQDFRDTFGGIKARSMRSEENRITCQNAQLTRALKA